MAKEGLPEELGHSHDVKSESSPKIILPSSREESKNDHQASRSPSRRKQDLHPDFSKRRLILWSRPKKSMNVDHFAAQLVQARYLKGLVSMASFRKERTTEIIRKLNKEWRPQVCFTGNDTCSTDATLKRMADTFKPAPTRFSPEDDDDSLHLQKLKRKAATYLPSLNENIWTIMAMTTSEKATFNAVIKELTSRTTPLKLNKPPFVALLERKDAGKSWSQDISLEPGEWKLVDLDENEAPDTSKTPTEKLETIRSELSGQLTAIVAQS